MAPITNLAFLALISSALAAPQGSYQQLEPYQQLQPYKQAESSQLTKPTLPPTYATAATAAHATASGSVSRHYGSMSSGRPHHSGKYSHSHGTRPHSTAIYATTTTAAGSAGNVPSYGGSSNAGSSNDDASSDDSANDDSTDDSSNSASPATAPSYGAPANNAPSYGDSPATSSNDRLTAAAAGSPTVPAGCATDAVVTMTQYVTMYVTEGQQQSPQTTGGAATTELTTTVYSTRTSKVTQTTTVSTTSSTAETAAGSVPTYGSSKDATASPSTYSTGAAGANKGIGSSPSTYSPEAAPSHDATTGAVASPSTYSTEAAPVASTPTTSARSTADKTTSVQSTAAETISTHSTTPATTSAPASTKQAPATTVPTTSSVNVPTTSSAQATSAKTDASPVASHPTTTTSSAGGLLGLIPTISIPTNIPVLGGSGSSGSAHSGKRGLAYNDASLCSAFKGSNEISWAYNWGVSSAGLNLPGIKYIPTMWGDKPDFTNGWFDKAKAAIAAGTDVIFSFNEPDQFDQSNMTPAQAADMYRKYMNPLKGLGAKLCAPSVTNGVKSSTGSVMGLPWLKEFLSQCSDCTIDCINIHWYDSASNVDYFKQHLNDANAVAAGRPVYVSEFGATNSSPEQVQTFLKTVMPWMDSQSWVAGYAYFMVAENNLLSNLVPSLFGSTYMSSS